MVGAIRTPPPPSHLAELSIGELEARYRVYRRHQATLLARALPRDAVRPLYRRAYTRSPPPTNDDPLAVLRGLCEDILPLPPFEIWKADLEAYPEEHLRDLGDWGEAPTVDRPATVEMQTFPHGGVLWQAFLRVYREPEGWRGLIAFQQDSGPVYRTAGVFHEADPAELRQRFLSFDQPALEAFLRSALH